MTVVRRGPFDVRNLLCEPVRVTYRTGLRPAETEIGKWRAETGARLAARAVMGRIGEPEDITNAVVFLISPEAGWITAQVRDGGQRANGLHRTGGFQADIALASGALPSKQLARE